MSVIVIFIVGVAVTTMTLIAVILVGIGEAGKPHLTPPQDLTNWEHTLVSEERAEHLKQAE